MHSPGELPLTDRPPRRPSFSSMPAGASLILVIVLLALCAPWLAPHDPEQMDMERRLASPTAEHLLGTDNFGRDLLSRALFGARITLSIAITSVGAAALLGTLVGLLAGYFGGPVDMVLMRIVDLFLGFPPLVLALGVVAALGPGGMSVTLALVAVFWTESARLVRAISSSEKNRDYVVAARALGASHARILLRDILPRVAGPLVVVITLAIGTAIVAESGLSFLGFGVQPPTPTWGWTLAYGVRYLRESVWLSIVPGLFIMATVLGFNLFGDGMRDRLDPRDAARGAARGAAQRGEI